MSPSWTGRGRCSQHVAAELYLPAAGTGNTSAGMPSGVLSPSNVSPKGQEGWITTQARDRGLQGPAFCGELEGHLFREQFKELHVMVRKWCRGSAGLYNCFSLRNPRCLSSGGFSTFDGMAFFSLSWFLYLTSRSLTLIVYFIILACFILLTF